MKPKLLAVLILVALLAVILVQNTRVVVFRIFFWTIAMSQVILVPMLLLFGFILGYLVAALGKGSRKKEPEKS